MNNPYNDRGVVLHSLKFSENQLIIHILTANRGRQSYITKVGRKGAGRNYFQPLSLIEFQASVGKGELHKLVSVASAHPLTDTPYNIVKSTIALFIAEVLYRIVKHESSDERIFNFVYSSIVALDLMQGPVANFHLHFMVRLSHYMGFAPQGRFSPGAWFDIKNGSFVDLEPSHTLKFAPPQAKLLWRLSDTSLEQISSINLSRDDRSKFLDSIVDFYGYHTESIYAVNSIGMFREIF